MKKSVLAVLVGFVLVLISIKQASAHVVVRPKEVSVGAFQTFTVGDPNEMDVPTIGVRLLIPEGLKHVSPNVKPGWKIDIVKEGEVENERVVEIIWSGGTIPHGQRDDFMFSAQVPSQEVTLEWKAYQTYQGGVVVAWDLAEDEQPTKEDGSPDFSSSGPFSETVVINDLVEEVEEASKADSKVDFGLVNGLALGVAGVSLGLHFMKKQD